MTEDLEKGNSQTTEEQASKNPDSDVDKKPTLRDYYDLKAKHEETEAKNKQLFERAKKAEDELKKGNEVLEGDDSNKSAGPISKDVIKEVVKEILGETDDSPKTIPPSNSAKRDKVEGASGEDTKPKTREEHKRWVMDSLKK